MKFKGYPRSDGRIGVRNYIVIVPTVLCSRSVCRSIGEATGVKVVEHEGGCGQLGLDREHVERVLEGVVSHPNVGACLIVGLGCEQVEGDKLARMAGDRPTAYLSIHDLGGNQKTVQRGIEAVQNLKARVAGTVRQEAALSELTIATQCGSSDTGSGIAANPVVGALADCFIKLGGAVILGETGSLYGAAGLLARRSISPEIGEKIIEATNIRERFYARMGKSIKEANPTPGNIKGGLTTLVEKSLGGIRKGGTTDIQGFLEAGEKISGKGLWVMDTSLGLGTCAMSDMLASGAQIMAYTTGKGNPVGSVLAPVVKICSTRETIDKLEDVVDFDASAVLHGEESVEGAGDRLMEKIVSVANGERVWAEKNGHCVFAIGKIVR